MHTFKMIFRIVLGLASALNALVAINNFFLGTPTVIGMALFYVNLIEYPLFVVFIFVFLINWLFMKKPVSFFKTELYYLLIQVCACILLALSYIKCPTCPG
jgi:hypothetical protein